MLLNLGRTEFDTPNNAYDDKDKHQQKTTF